MKRGLPDCVCILAESNGFGGAEIHTLGLISELLRQGASVTLIEASGKHYESSVAKFLDHAGFSYRSIDISIKDSSFSSLLRLRRELKLAGSRIIVLPKIWTSIPFAKILLLGMTLGMGAIVIQHFIPPDVPRLPRKKLLGYIPVGLSLWRFRRIFDIYISSLLAEVTIAVSQSVKSRLVSEYGIAPHRVRVIRSGVIASAFRRNPSKGSAFRVSLDIPHDCFVFGMLSRIDHVKGIDLAIRAMALLRQSHPQRKVHLIITGKGETEIGQLQTLASTLNVQDIVSFAPFSTDVVLPLSSYDVILMPSRTEALGLALLEGMATGCIPIASNVGGIPEILSSPRLGWLVEPNDEAALHAALVNALELSEEDRASMSASVVQHVRENFDDARCVTALADLVLTSARRIRTQET